MKNKKYNRFSIALIVSMMLSSVLFVSESETTTTAFTFTESSKVDIYIDDWIPNVGAGTAILDGGCLTVSANKPYSKSYMKFTFQISRNSNMSSPVTKTVTSDTPVNYNSAQFIGLPFNTTYYYRARADDSERPDWSNTKSIVTGASAVSGFECK